MTCHRRTLLACAALGALSAALPAAAQDSWPTKTVRLIVPYAAGGFADTRARKIADALGKTLGQPVIVDNRAGAGGVTGTDAIAKATDGHTFGFGSPAPLVPATTSCTWTKERRLPVSGKGGNKPRATRRAMRSRLPRPPAP